MLFKITSILAVLLISRTSGSQNKTCNKYLRELGDAQMHFLYCVTTNSVPVTLCTSCQGNYQNMSIAYDLLASQCASMYFDKDRINLVASTESVLASQWTKAYCDDCYNNDNGIVFQDKYSDFDTCLASFKNDSCEKCKNEYKELNSFYINLNQHNNGEVCFDLQDLMNRTRNKWSKELKCCRREYKMTLFTIALSTISCLPLLFYFTTYFITARRERNYHALTDEAPSPSTSGQSNVNNINNPSQHADHVTPSVTTSASTNIHSPNFTSDLNPTHKKSLDILNIDSESSDEEMAYNYKPNIK